MHYKNYLFIFIFIMFLNCTAANLKNNKTNLISYNNYTNKGFALIYDETLYKEGIISNKIDERSMTIFQRNLKKNTQVKITNIFNNKSLIATVGKKSDYPHFNNSVISSRIALDLDLNIDEPYIEIIAISKNSLFVAKKAKTYDEEKKVIDKAPVNTISISDLNQVKIKIKEKSNKEFSYLIKIADFYYNDTALIMVDRIKKETLIKKPKIKKISNKNYRVYLGPFDNIKSLQKSYNDINILQFENIEIIRND